VNPIEFLRKETFDRFSLHFPINRKQGVTKNSFTNSSLQKAFEKYPTTVTGPAMSLQMVLKICFMFLSGYVCYSASVA